LRQILLNLVGNAIKFTGRGSVTLSLEQAPAIDGRVELRFSVADSGIGIVPEAVDRMFQDFTQMDASISRRFGGSGLGLAICRRLVELMGGTITVESQPGLGSVFRFDVMVRPASDLPAAGATVVSEPETARNLRVLVAEDNLTNQFVALRLLERLGHHAEAVGDGAAAVSRLGLEPDHYDLVLMDVMMPEMDGLTATRRIRASEGLGSHVTIVGLTAGARAENLSDCLTAGMDAVTTKPVTLASLRAAIAEGLEAAGRRPGCLEADPCPADLREALGDDLLQDILVMFGEDTQINLDVMRDAASRNDLQTLGRIAHSVAGAARTVGAAGLDVVATRLQHDVGSLSASTICAAIDAMQAEFDAALAGLGIAPVNQPGTEAVCGLTGPDQRSPNLAAAGRP
jgi:CheY-like chemotaxis protein/HPt (histidine-containing phosphotransfer) domain-containing protein